MQSIHGSFHVKYTQNVMPVCLCIKMMGFDLFPYFLPQTRVEIKEMCYRMLALECTNA